MRPSIIVRESGDRSLRIGDDAQQRGAACSVGVGLAVGAGSGGFSRVACAHTRAVLAVKLAVAEGRRSEA
jgi:hypothetical protein